VQAIEDNAQKWKHNKISKDDKRLFKYYLREIRDGDKQHRLVELLKQDELIATVFAEQVEQQIYHERANHLKILDSDQEASPFLPRSIQLLPFFIFRSPTRSERYQSRLLVPTSSRSFPLPFVRWQLFWLLLSLPVPVSGGDEAKEVNITVEDVLGPLPEEGERISHWSMLHYSINLNPALRQQISADVESYVSSSELMRINDKGDAVSESHFFCPEVIDGGIILLLY
jgi:hypothetical protein